MPRGRQPAGIKSRGVEPLNRGCISGRLTPTFCLSLLFVLPLLLAADFQPLPSDPLIAPVHPFTLRDQDGKPFTPEQLRGKVWVAHFFFTTCTQGCEKTALAMKELQDRFRGKRDVVLVSISVNPENDSPDLLSAYAKDIGAEPGQWFFLTGPEKDVHDIVQKSFYQAVARNHGEKDPQKQIMHTFNLMIVDRDGNKVGYVEGRQPDSAEAVFRKVLEIASRRYTLPALNAGFNSAAALLLIGGYLAIRTRRETLHKAMMLAALTCSALFLAGYLYFHFMILRGESLRFVGPGPVRALYLAILLSHTVLAIVVAPLALIITYQGLTNQRPRHVKLARWTLPIWLYVSITGVVVYVMLYQIYPPY